ncbi:kelch-like protein 10 [Zootermopsis nevadensis]|uniref:kelch-like protein 10 n=1 Tax=Zootermopsis nevadensis TaxID=136037 RepID=UPI000B8ECABA|nr:kelch-like protein 10 [Zootermopsis nevadensis]
MEVRRESGCPEQDGVRCTCTEESVRLNELREENLLCDAVLRLEDGGVFRVHRVILSMFSDYFRTLFTTTLHASEETDILLHGVRSDALKQILNYVYLREINIHSDNACQLFVTAKYLCVPGVVKLCGDFLKVAMDADNCTGIMQFARFHFCPELDTHALRFLLYHFVEVSHQNEDLLELPAEELQAIIGSEELNVKYEKDVWECVLRWINHDPDSRKDHIVGLLKGVRLGLLDAKYFLQKISNHAYVTENEGCGPLILETHAFLRDVQMLTKEENADKEFVTPRIAYPRIPQDILFAIGGRCDGRPTDVIEAYDARADRWSVVEGVDSIGPRARHGTAVVGFDIYIIGGYDGEEELRSCHCFNAVMKTWREVAPMNVCRCSLMVAVLRGAVYAMGGGIEIEELRTAEKYDRKANQWSLIAPMNLNRRDASAAVLNDKIYVAGGNYICGYFNLVEVYDPDTNQWTFVASMISERTGLSCVAFHGCLYALGENSGHSE